MTRKRHTDARNPSPESALARQEYVGAVPGPDEPSVADLAAEHGYSAKALQAVAAQEDWTGLRAKHRRRLEAARQRALIVEAAEAVGIRPPEHQGRPGRARPPRAFLVEEGAPSLDANSRPRARPGLEALRCAGHRAGAAHAATGGPRCRRGAKAQMLRGSPGRSVSKRPADPLLPEAHPRTALRPISFRWRRSIRAEAPVTIGQGSFQAPQRIQAD